MVTGNEQFFPNNASLELASLDRDCCNNNSAGFAYLNHLIVTNFIRSPRAHCVIVLLLALYFVPRIAKNCGKLEDGHVNALLTAALARNETGRFVYSLFYDHVYEYPTPTTLKIIGAITFLSGLVCLVINGGVGVVILKVCLCSFGSIRRPAS